jgi:signal transduction histidine kinase
VQEGLINALRHAHASHVDIVVNSDRQRIVVTVADDGIGMTASETPPGHFGLRGLAERIARLGGVFNINRHEPHGVCLVAEIPLTGNT